MLRPRSLSLFALTLALALTACDGSEPDTTCEALDLLSTGTFTATVDGSTYRAECFDVTVDEGRLFVTGFRTYSLVDFVTVVIGDTEVGAYDLEGEVQAYVDYAAPNGGEGYTTGTITLESYSSSRVQGRFDVATEGGESEASGRFDVRY